MCGITGFLHFNKSINEGQLRKMADQMAYRGPDDEGFCLEEGEDFQVGLGFKRLAVLDLSQSGHQPMHFEGLTIVFNGEVYNYRGIREKLRGEGYSFSSGSDTEVVLKAYHFWGKDCVHHFNGMFAIGIYDREKEEIVLYRDRFGIKPLYYSVLGEDLLFASEMGPMLKYPFIKAEIDDRSLSAYLYHGHIASEGSMIKGVKKLKPGNMLVYGKGEIKIHGYYQPEFKIDKKIEEEDALATLDDLARKAVERRMVADVPLGCFLSGGYDSSLVSAIMQDLSHRPVATFSLGFEEKDYDESKHAAAVAKHLHTDHHELIVSIDQVRDLVEDLPSRLDEPLGDASVIPTWIVSRMARKDVTVVLSGDGGDELFAGYKNYQDKLALYKKKHLSLPFHIGQQLFDLSAILGKINHRYAKYPYLFKDMDIINYNYLVSVNYLKGLQKNKEYQLEKRYFDDPAKNQHFMEKYSLLDLQTYLPADILTKVDRASMMHSLEARTPLLDYELVDFALTVPMAMKMKDGGKYLLKQLTHRYIPRKIMERPKKGFAFPVFGWLKKDLFYLVDEYLSGDGGFVKNQDKFSPGKMKKLVAAFKKSNTNNYVESIVWNLLVFQMWWKKNLM